MAIAIDMLTWKGIFSWDPTLSKQNIGVGNQ